MSRTIKFAKAGGPEVLEFLETEVPTPGPTEVRIKVKAIGINRAESMWRADAYIEPVAKFPAGLGYEAAGLADSVGRDVRQIRESGQLSRCCHSPKRLPGTVARPSLARPLYHRVEMPK